MHEFDEDFMANESKVAAMEIDERKSKDSDQIHAKFSINGLYSEISFAFPFMLLQLTYYSIYFNVQVLILSVFQFCSS